jgi:hypothetical protein
LELFPKNKKFLKNRENPAPGSGISQFFQNFQIFSVSFGFLAQEPENLDFSEIFRFFRLFSEFLAQEPEN